MKSYYPAINLLRGIAAFMVCFYHATIYQDIRGALFSSGSFISATGSFGVNGVYIFFVISGFVITLSLSKENFKLGQLPRFLSRRFIRIEIPYLVSILLILLVGLLFTIKNNTDYIFNPQQFFYHIIYFIPFSNFAWYNIIYWTLAIEFQFYIIIGLLYFFLSSNKKIMLIIVMLLFGTSGFIVSDSRFVFHYSTIFLQGIILFLIKKKKITAKIGVLLIVMCVLSTVYIHSIEIAAFSALTVIGIQYLEVSNKTTNQFGSISYSLYLTHGLIGGNILYFFCAVYHKLFRKIAFSNNNLGGILTFFLFLLAIN